MPWNPNIVNSEILAVHAALMPTGNEGEVLFLGGDEHWDAQQESKSLDAFKKTRLYDVQGNKVLAVAVESPGSDIFCSGHAFGGDGRLVLAGGTSEWPSTTGHHAGHELNFLGHARTWVYNPRDRHWNETARMNPNPAQADDPTTGGRWYPGVTPLGDGSVMAFFGHLQQKDLRHRNTLPERFVPAAQTWINAPTVMAEPIEPGGSVRYLFYPRVLLLPDGTLFFATPMPTQFATSSPAEGPYSSTRYNPWTGQYIGPDIAEPNGAHYLSWSAPATILPLLPEDNYRPRVLFCGDVTPQIIDLDPAIASPQWKPAGTRAQALQGRRREHANSVILPTGQICIVGGMHFAGNPRNAQPPEDPVREVELYTPGIDWTTGLYNQQPAWSAKEPAQHNRNYHSTALLLPNGKVWTAGGNDRQRSGNPQQVGTLAIELYEPDYIAIPNRISITTAPEFASYNDAISIVLDRAATSVRRVALIRCASVTHSTNNDQRYVGLRIKSTAGNTLTAEVPSSSSILPPGYYMLWVTDQQDAPCQLARFVRIGHLTTTVVIDRSTFSEDEVQALGGGGQALFYSALYVAVDGLLASEDWSPPTVSVVRESDGSAVASSLFRVDLVGRFQERSDRADVPQRITYAYSVAFPTPGLYTEFTDTARLKLTFGHQGNTAVARLFLTKKPNPYMLDIEPGKGNPEWLSTDVRAFALADGQPRFGLTQRSDQTPQELLRGLLDELNRPGGNSLFGSLPVDGVEAQLILWPKFFDTRFFNYAIARVRYRASATVAQRVKVFFRMFSTESMSLEYDTSASYRNSSNGASTVPLLGVAGGEVSSIPFFLDRVETVSDNGGVAMTQQPLDGTYEVRDIQPGGGEVTVFFGCVLDFNSSRPRFPIAPGATDGPWPASECKGLVEHVRGRHQCLVAEVFFEPDPTSPGSGPSSSDNLAQRNLAIMFSDNPGAPASHTVVHTFELAPTKVQYQLKDLFTRNSEILVDQLLFKRGSIPRDAIVRITFSDVHTDEVRRLLVLRNAPPAFDVVDHRTLEFHAGDVTWVPVPGRRQTNLPCMLTIELPSTVKSGQRFEASLHQLERGERVVGSVQISIPVTKADAILTDESRTLSVMKHIATTIPPWNRWYEVFQRYVLHLGRRVDALGGDSRNIHPNPDGTGTPMLPPAPAPRPGLLKQCACLFGAALLIALALVVAALIVSH
jgi:hypothetical protein